MIAGSGTGTWVWIRDVRTGSIHPIDVSSTAIGTQQWTNRRATVYQNSTAGTAWRVALPYMAPYFSSDDLLAIANTCTWLRLEVTARDSGAATAWQQCSEGRAWTWLPRIISIADAPSYLCCITARVMSIRNTLRAYFPVSALRPGVTGAALAEADARLGYQLTPWLRALFIVCDGQPLDVASEYTISGRRLLGLREAVDAAASAAALATAEPRLHGRGGLSPRVIPLTPERFNGGDILAVDCRTDKVWMLRPLTALPVARHVRDLLWRTINSSD